MGGGGFAMEPENLLLDHYMLSLTGKPKPKVCFIGTASGDAQGYIDKFYAAYRTLDCIPSHLSLFLGTPQSVEQFILEQDLIHVGGGNTRNLLSLWREWKLDQILLKAYQQGIVLSGMSAGMVCWFEQGMTDSFGPVLSNLDCLGWLPGSACPEIDRRPTFIKQIQGGIIKGGLALDDGAGALYWDGELKECVSSRLLAKATHFEIQTANETQMPIRFLGK